MQSQNVAGTVSTIIYTMLGRIYAYVPQFLGGLIILLIGIYLAGLVKKAVLELCKRADFKRLKKYAKFLDDKALSVWVGILAELLRATVLVLFLVPAVEAWGISGINNVLNQLLLYIPNIFVAALIGFVGFVAARLVSDIVLNAAKGLKSKQAKLLASLANYSLLFFTALVVLNQLGIAGELVQVLFTGIVAMFSIAGGLAFGLGGQDLAKDILSQFRTKIRR